MQQVETETESIVYQKHEHTERLYRINKNKNQVRGQKALPNSVLLTIPLALRIATNGKCGDGDPA